MRNIVLWTMLAAGLVLGLRPAPAQTATDYLLWQTNAEGDDITIFDAETGDFARRLEVGPNPHGIAWAPGSDTIFVSLEKNGAPAGTLLWINKTDFSIEHRLEIGPEPHAIAVTPDGRYVYVPCRDGTYWVVDAQAREVITKIKTGGRPHNTTASPDGSRVYLSPMGSPQKVTIIDPQDGHRPVGHISFSASVRPPAIAPSRNLFFQHVDGLNGFEVADLTSSKMIARVEHSQSLGIPVMPSLAGFLSFSGLSRCHGLAVRPGDNEIWSVCGANATIHDIGHKSFPETAHIDLPAKGYWLTFTPEGDTVFIALSASSQVAMVDTSNRGIMKLLTAGHYPKRNIVVPK